MYQWEYNKNHPDYWLINEAWLRIYKINLLKEKIPFQQFVIYTSILATDTIQKSKTKFGEVCAILNYNNEFFKIDKEYHNQIVNLKIKLAQERNINLQQENSQILFKQMWGEK